MRHLYKVFNEQDRSIFDKHYDKRMQFDAAIKFNLYIKPIDQPETYQLYYIPTNKMIMQVSLIQKLSRSLNDTYEKLPDVARDQFLLECLIEELYNTNELEGVRSTKEEIARSTRDVQSNKKNNSRFYSMASLYLSLVKGEISLPKVPKDIRTIYDDITKGEIEEEELPDGDMFRADTTFVYKKSGSGKVIHRGVTPESRVIQEIDDILKFMNVEEIPMIIKAAVGHFFFGYIHPFYDGNGRTSRFISSMYMSSELGHISAMSLSRGCNKYTKKYLEAFENTNSIKNRGEMNHFIEVFMEIIIGALQEMNAELKEKDEFLTTAGIKISNEEKLKNEKNKELKELMYVIAQNYFFDTDDGITVRELVGAMNLSEPTVRKLLSNLMELGLIIKKGTRPAFYTIQPAYFEL